MFLVDSSDVSLTLLHKYFLSVSIFLFSCCLGPWIVIAAARDVAECDAVDDFINCEEIFGYVLVKRSQLSFCVLAFILASTGLLDCVTHDKLWQDYEPQMLKLNSFTAILSLFCVMVAADFTGIQSLEMSQGHGGQYFVMVATWLLTFMIESKSLPVLCRKLNQTAVHESRIWTGGYLLAIALFWADNLWYNFESLSLTTSVVRQGILGIMIICLALFCSCANVTNLSPNCPNLSFWLVSNVGHILIIGSQANLKRPASDAIWNLLSAFHFYILYQFVRRRFFPSCEKEQQIGFDKTDLTESLLKERSRIFVEDKV